MAVSTQYALLLNECDDLRTALAESEAISENRNRELLNLVTIVAHIRAHHRHDEQACSTAIQDLLVWLSGLEARAALPPTEPRKD